MLLKILWTLIFRPECCWHSWIRARRKKTSTKFLVDSVFQNFSNYLSNYVVTGSLRLLNGTVFAWREKRFLSLRYSLRPRYAREVSRLIRSPNKDVSLDLHTTQTRKKINSGSRNHGNGCKLNCFIYFIRRSNSFQDALPLECALMARCRLPAHHSLLPFSTPFFRRPKYREMQSAMSARANFANEIGCKNICLDNAYYLYTLGNPFSQTSAPVMYSVEECRRVQSREKKSVNKHIAVSLHRSRTISDELYRTKCTSTIFTTSSLFPFASLLHSGKRRPCFQPFLAIHSHPHMPHHTLTTSRHTARFIKSMKRVLLTSHISLRRRNGWFDGRECVGWQARALSDDKWCLQIAKKLDFFFICCLALTPVLSLLATDVSFVSKHRCFVC